MSAGPVEPTEAQKLAVLTWLHRGCPDRIDTQFHERVERCRATLEEGIRSVPQDQAFAATLKLVTATLSFLPLFVYLEAGTCVVVGDTDPRSDWKHWEDGSPTRYLGPECDCVSVIDVLFPPVLRQLVRSNVGLEPVKAAVMRRMEAAVVVAEEPPVRLSVREVIQRLLSAPDWNAEVLVGNRDDWWSYVGAVELPETVEENGSWLRPTLLLGDEWSAYDA